MQATDPKELAQNLSVMSFRLAERDKTFAASLVESLLKGKGSEKQLYWASILLERARGDKPSQVTITLSQPLRALIIGEGKVKKPSLTFPMGDGQLKLSLAGPASRYIGQVIVSDGVFGSDNYWGRVDGATFYPTAKCPADVKDLIQQLCNDPADTIGKYGRLSGRCVVCNTPIKDDRSLSVGYGPTCAKRLKLPY